MKKVSAPWLRFFRTTPIPYGSMREANERQRAEKAVFDTLSNGEEYSGAEIRANTGIKTGTLYPTLLRLETESILSSRWADEARPRRRLYRMRADTPPRNLPGCPSGCCEASDSGPFIPRTVTISNETRAANDP